jgi:hypothetical protein
MIECASDSDRLTERMHAALSHSRARALIVRVTHALHDRHNVESESVIETVDDGNVESRQRMVSQGRSTGHDRDIDHDHTSRSTLCHCTYPDHCTQQACVLVDAWRTRQCVALGLASRLVRVLITERQRKISAPWSCRTRRGSRGCAERGSHARQRSRPGHRIAGWCDRVTLHRRRAHVVTPAAATWQRDRCAK